MRLAHTRLVHEEKHLMHEYFENQNHGSLGEYLTHRLLHNRPADTVFLQVWLSLSSMHIIWKYQRFHLRLDGVSELSFCMYLFQVTTHSRLLSGSDALNLAQSLKYHPECVTLLTLQAFDTEQQLSKCTRCLILRFCITGKRLTILRR